MSRCILTVACGKQYELMSNAMIDTFLKYNNGWDIEKVYGDSIKVPVMCLSDGHITPFDACEIGRWIAMRSLLDKYDEVLYCDNDLWWYSEYKPLDAGIVLSPHCITDKAKWDYRNMMFNAGIYNEGLIYAKGDDGKKACDYIIYHASENRRRILSPTTGQIWIQYLEPFLAEIGIDCKVDLNPGANVAFWNLTANDRKILEKDGKYVVECGGMEVPLQSFHFSSSSLERLPLMGEPVNSLAKEYIEMQKLIRFNMLQNGNA